jgi:phosphoribosylformylglycinamidine (FGAM) synthase PurS component
MLDEKLQANLNQCTNLDQKLCFKDKISKLQQQDADNVADIIKSVEAALLGNSVINQTEKTNLSVVDEEAEVDQEEIDENQLSDNLRVEVPEKEQDSICNENVISGELENLLSGNESDDSFDRLILNNAKPAIKRKIDDTDVLASPISALPRHQRFKKFKSFNTNSHLQGPSYASSPISKHLDVELNHSKTNLDAISEEIDELNRILAKYNKNASPIGSKPKTKSIKSPAKRKINVQKSAMKDTVQLPPIPVTQEDSEEKENAFEYISIDNVTPSDYSVILLIDNGEAGRNKAFKEIQEKLMKNNVVSDVRKLHVGDFLWIAKHKTDPTRELVLPYIIERKRIDDFGSSIKDGRFHDLSD